LFCVSRLARERVKVVLTGEGADEIFAGYLKYRATLWNLRGGDFYTRHLPASLRGVVRQALSLGVGPDWLLRKLRHSFLYYSDGSPFEEMHFDNFYCAFSKTQQNQLLSAELSEELGPSDPYQNSMKFFSGTSKCGDLLSRLLYLDIKTYLVELLMKQDQMSMAASIESRVPFLDHKLVEFVSALPANLKIRNWSGKYLLRRAMEERLPKLILKRTKKGFPTPIRPWLRGPLFEKLSQALSDGRLADRKLVNQTFVNRLLAAHRSGDSRATDGCWRLLNLELWHRVFIDGNPADLTQSRYTVDRMAACA
jgi:asparagine synthase (glutamine-hydrolysing)